MNQATIWFLLSGLVPYKSRPCLPSPERTPCYAFYVNISLTNPYFALPDCVTSFKVSVLFCVYLQSTLPPFGSTSKKKGGV